MSNFDAAAAQARLADPAVSPSELADIAHQHPTLRAQVAAHPIAYPELLAWLGEIGDPAIDAVIAARDGTAVMAVTPVADAADGASHADDADDADDASGADSTDGAEGAEGADEVPSAGSALVAGATKSRGPLFAVVGGIAVLAVAGGAFALSQRGGDAPPPAEISPTTAAPAPPEASPTPTESPSVEPSEEPEPAPEPTAIPDPGATLMSYPATPSVHWQIKADEIIPGGSMFMHPSQNYFASTVGVEASGLVIVSVTGSDRSVIAGLDPESRTVRWTLDSSGDGLTYGGCDGVATSGELFCVKTSGELGDDGILEVLDAQTGKIRAEARLTGRPLAVVATGDGTVIVATIDQDAWEEAAPIKVQEFDRDAGLRWTWDYELADEQMDPHELISIDVTESLPVVHLIGVSYRMDRSGGATLIDKGTSRRELKDGSVLWAQGYGELDDYFYDALTVDDGAGTERMLAMNARFDYWSAPHARPDRPLLALSPNHISGWDHTSGAALWQTPFSGSSWPAITYIDEAILFHYGEDLAAFDPRDGSELWTGSAEYSEVSALSDGDRFIITGTAEIAAFSARTGEVEWRVDTPGDASGWYAIASALYGRLAVSAGDTLTIFAP